MLHRGLSVPRLLARSPQSTGTPLAKCVTIVEMPHDPGIKRKSVVYIKIKSLSNLYS